MKKNKNKTQNGKPLIQPDEIENFVRLRDAKFESLIDTVFSTMEDLDEKNRMSLFRAVLHHFLERYASVTEMIAEKRKSQDIMSTFRSSNHTELNENIKMCVSEMLNLIEGKECKPIISRLVSLYATLGVSDKAGSKKCYNLAKDLISSKNRPELLALSVLKKRALRKGEEIPHDEHELLERYSF